MKKRELELFSTHGERIVQLHYSKSNLITCGICGNQTPEELYLNNDCPHCQLGIDYEVESESSDERLEELERKILDFEDKHEIDILMERVYAYQEKIKRS